MFWEKLQRRFKRSAEPGILRDVLDGREYLKHQEFVTNPGNITLLLNTDGVKMFQSSAVSLWPIWLAINELPPNIRYMFTCMRLFHYHDSTYPPPPPTNTHTLLNVMVDFIEATSFWLVCGSAKTNQPWPHIWSHLWMSSKYCLQPVSWHVHRCIVWVLCIDQFRCVYQQSCRWDNG